MRWALILLGGCNSILGVHPFPNTQECNDTAGCPGEIDAAVDALDGRCFGPTGSRFEICLNPIASSVVLPRVLDTDTDSLCLAVQAAGWTGARDACFVVGTSITTGSSVIVTGKRPLVLLATSAITVDGVLDVGSHVGGPGAGANSSACVGGTPGESATGTGGGGGGGGSFQSIGGSGGAGGGNAASGGIATDPGPATTLRGGCAGQLGGNAGAGCVPGDGGGAVYLIAGGSITIAGTIDASGAGGLSPNVSTVLSSGGSGGGSGGMIVLFAPIISIGTSAQIFANGGGGAGGGDGAGMAGESGGDAISYSQPAIGGTAGSDGGQGFALGFPTTSGTSGAAGKGGGGGGGGAGYVLSNVTINGMISPTPATL